MVIGHSAGHASEIRAYTRGGSVATYPHRSALSSLHVSFYKNNFRTGFFSNGSRMWGAPTGHGTASSSHQRIATTPTLPLSNPFLSPFSLPNRAPLTTTPYTPCPLPILPIFPAQDTVIEDEERRPGGGGISWASTTISSPS